MRMRWNVWNLRSRRCYRLIHACFLKARGRFAARLIEYSVQGNHLHLIIEADDSGALTKAMQGLAIRIAKALNRLMNRGGRVFSDHFHSRILKTPAELVNAIAYVLGNHAHHFGETGPGAVDRYSSAALAPERRERILSHPRTWLLRTGWRRAQSIPHWLRL